MGRADKREVVAAIEKYGFDSRVFAQRLCELYERSMEGETHMIHILFFIESLSGGGAEKVLCNLVNAMDQTRFAITVQTLYPENAKKYLAPGIRYKYCYPAKSRVSSVRMRIEAAAGLTYPLHIKDDYDIEAAYLEVRRHQNHGGLHQQKSTEAGVGTF